MNDGLESESAHRVELWLEMKPPDAEARILLPSELLRAEFRARDPYDPSALRQLAEKAAVSPQMLINRIGELSGSFNGLGGCAYVKSTEGGYRLEALRMRSALRDLFPCAVVGSPISDLVPDPEFVLNGGTAFDRTVEVQCRTNMSKLTRPVRFLCENGASAVNKPGLFLTLERVEDHAA